MKKHKMDRHLVSRQKWELDYIANKLTLEGHKCWKGVILEAIRVVGRSRRKVYTYLRNNF